MEEPGRLLAAGERMTAFSQAWREWTAQERAEVCRLMLSSVRVDLEGKGIAVQPQEEFRELFAARALWVRAKVDPTPDRTRFLSLRNVYRTVDLRR